MTVMRCTECLFSIVMDRLTTGVRVECPWTTMYADTIVVCCENRGQMKENLVRWRPALQRRGMKVSCSKEECMCVDEKVIGGMKW